MKQFFAALLLLTALSSKAQSYSRYLIQLTNKANTPYTLANPAAYLSQRALDRRLRYHIAIDSADLPVTTRYLDSIRAAGAVTILNVSKWLNQVSVRTTDSAALARINAFPFVLRVAAIAAKKGTGPGKTGTQEKKGKRSSHKRPKGFNPSSDFYNYGASYPQIHLHNGEFLHNIGLRGQGMVMGMLDAGFYHYTTSTSLDSLNQNGQVLGSYDFVAGKSSVVEADMHGLYCLHVIAANAPGFFVGAAPKANFYLFRTEESATEYPIEEHNWVCGAESVDSAGGDVISSSLGYSDGMSDASFDHSYADMNGRTTIAARGAAIAARKGILVVNSAGNQGTESFHYISTPADADSVLAVGATDKNGNVAPFSSYGPSADGRVKPDLASEGFNTVVTISGDVRSGTSFACPNLAGLATCLWQGFPEFNNIKILNALRQAGSRASAPDNRIGYGIPDMKKATLLLLKDFSTATVTATSCKNILHWTSKDAAGMQYEVERKGPGETSFSKIGTKNAAGTNFSSQQYQYADSLLNMQAGTITYRIRQIIDTSFATAASADYIDTISVVLASTCITTAVPTLPLSGDGFTLTPNPATDKISMRMDMLQAIPALFLRITDSKGSLLWQQPVSKPSGPATVEVPVRQLAKGTYYLLIDKEGRHLATKKFIRL